MTSRATRVQIKGEDPKYPIAFDVELIAPVRIYTAVELAAMPLSQMIRCRDAQEEFYINNKKLSGRAKDIKDRLVAGEKLTLVLEKKTFKSNSDVFHWRRDCGQKNCQATRNTPFYTPPKSGGYSVNQAINHLGFKNHSHTCVDPHKCAVCRAYVQQTHISSVLFGALAKLEKKHG
ncbi:hypothetical protein ACQ1OW_001707 [Acinetobacter baumannii]